MNRHLLSFLLLFIILVPAQALIFNNMVLFNVAMPFVYILMILKLPLNMSVNIVMTLAFVSGLAVDIFSDTMGINTIAAVVTAFVRKPVARIYLGADAETEELKPSAASMGSAAFIKYALTASLIYCTLVFTIEAFQFFNLRLLLLRIACSTLFTFMLIFALDSLTLSRSRSEKRL